MTNSAAAASTTRPRAGRKTVAFIAIGQVCLLGVTPLLTRRFTVTDIAIYQLGFALAIICQPLSTLRLELVVPVRTMAAAQRLFRVSALSNLMLSVLLTGIGGLLHLAEPGSDLPAVLISSGLILLVIGNVTADNSWLIRRGQLDKLAWRNLATGALGGVFQLCVATTWVSSVSLATAYVAGRLVAMAITVPVGRRPVADSGDGDDSVPYTWRRATASILALTLSSVSLQAPVIVTALMFGTNDSGQIALAQRIAGVPGSLLSLGVAQYVMYQASALIRAGDKPLAPFVASVARRLVLLGLVIAPVLAVAGPILVPVVFGADWQVAGYALAIFAVPFGLQISVFPMLAVYGLVGRDTRILVLQSLRAGALIVSTVLAAWISDSVLVTAAVAAVAITLSYLSIIHGAQTVARDFDASHDRPQPTFAPYRRFGFRHADVRTAGSRGSGVVGAYLLTAAITLAVVVAVFNRQVLPARYFNDDARIQEFIAYPYLVTRDGSYRGTADLYRLLHLGGHPTLVALLALGMYLAVLLRALNLTARDPHGFVYWTVVAGSIAFGSIYLPMYSKEFFILPIVLAFVTFTSRAGRFVWIALAVAYAFLVRSYWFAVVALFAANLVAVRTVRTTRARLAYLVLVFVGVTLVLSSGFGNTVGYQRETTLAHLSFDPTTAIHTPFGGGFLANVANVSYVFATLLVPVPLLTKGPVYLIAALFLMVCWWCVWRTVRPHRGNPAAAERRTSRLAREAGCLLLAYALTLALFEPDYGSYLRHLTPLFPLFLLLFQRDRIDAGSGREGQRVGVVQGDGLVGSTRQGNP